jgi:hypothetical protein
MTPEDLHANTIKYWRNEARRLNAAIEGYSADVTRWRNKYHRACRIMRRFVWATMILGALLGIAVAVIVIGWK